MSTFSSKSQHRSTSSISPFRTRKIPAPAPSGPRPSTPTGRPTTPSSSSRPPPPSKPPPSISPPSTLSPSTPTSDRPDFAKSKENVTVTVRFRPLSPREINRGDEIAWYADGDYTVRNEYNASVAYGFGQYSVAFGCRLLMFGAF